MGTELRPGQLRAPTEAAGAKLKRWCSAAWRFAGHVARDYIWPVVVAVARFLWMLITRYAWPALQSAWAWQRQQARTSREQAPARALAAAQQLRLREEAKIVGGGWYTDPTLTNFTAAFADQAHLNRATQIVNRYGWKVTNLTVMSGKKSAIKAMAGEALLGTAAGIAMSGQKSVLLAVFERNLSASEAQ